PNKNINFDREDFLEVLGNLVDNACKWARGHIQITVTFDNGLVMIVADDGPGCPEQEIPFLPQRGFRVDQHVSGHGLGLAIIQDIVEFYNGNLIISRSPDLGGLLATVIFPLSNVNNN
ncbi:MAG: ATP-binding protein, partial [Synechocystis sp.]